MAVRQTMFNAMQVIEGPVARRLEQGTHNRNWGRLGQLGESCKADKY